MAERLTWTTVILGLCVGLVSAGTNCNRIDNSSTSEYPDNGCAKQLCLNDRILPMARQPVHPDNDGTAIRVYTTGKDANGNTDVIESPVSVPYAKKDTTVVAFYYTALVHVDKGVPTEITFEYGDCSGCDEDKCVPDIEGIPTTCGFDVSNRCTIHNDKLCQPKTYVAFTGTDRKGIVLTSSGSMLTRFSKYSLSKVYDSVTNQV